MSLLEPPSTVLKLLHESFPLEPTAENEDVLNFVSFLAAGLADADEFDTATWQHVLTPYLQSILPDPKVTIESFRLATNQVFSPEDDADSYGGDDDVPADQVLCDLRFNLAYGGKILLHQTKLKLVRGHRYALVGQNGVGKTTLMNAIVNNKIDGWPQELKTAYVDSGSNVDPNFELLNVMQHILDSTGKSEAECKEKLFELEFTEEMLEGCIGALSGGWQMKMRLVRAVLQEPDIFLLDEPTNHLSHSAVTWITEFLQNLKTQTLITVSHDTTFLENVCTDVIHYEQRSVWGPYRKLVHYKGKMSAFVEKQPAAKHYFELAVSEEGIRLEFPEPGRLEGVKTSTQKFMELEHVDFRYPGANRNQLTDINLKMTLSSRVVVLGKVRSNSDPFRDRNV